MNDLIKPFQLNVSEQELSELRERLQWVRWPDRETVNDTSQGPQLLKLQALVAHWKEGYDWRRCESMLNDFGQFKTTIDSLDIHFLHIRSPEPDAIPLLMAHGGPGSGRFRAMKRKSGLTQLDPHVPSDTTRSLPRLPKCNSHSGSRRGREVLSLCCRWDC